MRAMHTQIEDKDSGFLEGGSKEFKSIWHNPTISDIKNFSSHSVVHTCR